ncbi:MAG: fatty acid--CoA ligase family protein [Steroidobacteraceae bacterium]|jgi:acyl-CoA synthetase (AMP-forming)/AMP-acid ligase II|nr:fatty acid--CoA ligase family protein [Steroidobacteraceae bacterium]
MSRIEPGAEAFFRRIQTIWTLESEARAIEFGARTFSWSELRAAVGAIDAALNDAGVGPAAAVGVLLRNRPGMLAAILALLLSDRCIVSLSPFQPEDDLHRELRELRLDAMIADAQDWKAGALRAALEADIVGLRLPDGELEPLQRVGRLGRSRSRRGEDLTGVALEILTSGTTGKPKRIRIGRATMADAVLEGARGGGQSTTPSLKTTPTVLFAPLMHVSGMFGALLSIYEGRPIVLLEKFSVEGWAAAVKHHRVRFSSLPPTPMRMVLEAGVPREDLASLIAVRAGTAPLPPETQRRFEETYGVPVLVQYGATEWMGGLAGWTLEDHRKYIAAKLGSVGRARGDVLLRVVDADSGRELPIGQVGVLEVLPRQRLGADASWTRTSDLASLDADGFLYIHGRVDDTIIRGGFKIDAAAVASVLMRHPAVQDASVVGLPDDRLGQAPVAAIELREGVAAPSEEELRAHAQQYLSPYQVPVRFKFVSALPRTVSMKISRPGVLALFA